MSQSPRYRWQPTTEAIATRFDLRPSEVVRFDHNTSPFTTDWAASIVAPLSRRLNEYPGASYAPLREAAARYLECPPDRIAPGAGVDEVILLVARAFLGPGTRAAAIVPTYPLYEIASLQAGAEFRTVSYEPPDFGWPDRAIGELAETSDLVWLCVPNNPTGHRPADVGIADVIASAKGLVVIDAAYAEFAGDRWAPWVSRHDNLIVCTTMSKAFGLAALRVGFAMAQPPLIEALDGVRPPGSISSMSAQIAEVALDTPQRMERHVDRLLRERARLGDELTGLGLAVVADRSANFLLCDVGDGAHELTRSLMREGLVVRAFPAGHPLASFLRFTVRTPDGTSASSMR